MKPKGEGGAGIGCREEIDGAARSVISRRRDREILHTSTGKASLEQPNLEHDPETDGDSATEEEEDAGFERVALETDRERLKRMHEVMGEDDLGALRDDDDDIVMISHPGVAPVDSQSIRSTQGKERKAGDDSEAGERFLDPDEDSEPVTRTGSSLLPGPASASSTVRPPSMPLPSEARIDTVIRHPEGTHPSSREKAEAEPRP